MICEEIMKRELQTTDEASSIQHAAEKMATANVGFLPVCDRNGQALGTITDRDITVRAVARGKAPGSTAVAEVMSREVISCRENDDLAVAEQRMVQHHKSRILVLDDSGRLKGVISLSDLAQRDPERRAAVVLRGVSAREASRH
jgi:CBS domain-containing protein